MATTLQSKLRGMGRLTGLTFASSLCFEDIWFVLGHKKIRKVKGEKGGINKRRKGKEGKKEGDREGGRDKETIFPCVHEIP